MSATQPVPGLEVDFEPDTEDLTALPVDADGEYEPSPYLQAVAQRVHRVIESAWWDQPLSVRDIAAILSEGLYQMHRDIRAGQKVDIEYLGAFERIGMGQPWVIYRAAAELLKEAPQ
jgi:hypothetical protein